jgi:hypothetical protein
MSCCHLPWLFEASLLPVALSNRPPVLLLRSVGRVLTSVAGSDRLNKMVLLSPDSLCLLSEILLISTGT